MVTVVRCAVWSGLPSSETFSSQWVGGPLHCGRRGCQSDALMKSCSSSVPLTGGALSPTRPGVFFITKRNGNIDVWDLMDRSHEPSLAQNISSMAITSIHPCMAANIQAADASSGRQRWDAAYKFHGASVTPLRAKLQLWKHSLIVKQRGWNSLQKEQPQ